MTRLGAGTFGVRILVVEIFWTVPERLVLLWRPINLFGFVFRLKKLYSFDSVLSYASLPGHVQILQ